MRTIAYVDGYNLYHGIKDKRNVVPKGITPFSTNKPWGDLLWLNLESFISSYGFPNVNLERINFFEAPSFDPGSLLRQQAYMNALLSLETMDNDSFMGGEFKPREVKCRSCGSTYKTYTEKGTDVYLSIKLIEDVVNHNCEAAVIVSGDNDYLPAIQTIKKYNSAFPIFFIFPPHRSSIRIAQIVGSNNCQRIYYNRLIDNQLPDLILINGFTIQKPLEYQRN